MGEPPIIIQFGSMPLVVANNYLLPEEFERKGNEAHGIKDDVYSVEEQEATTFTLEEVKESQD